MSLISIRQVARAGLARCPGQGSKTASISPGCQLPVNHENTAGQQCDNGQRLGEQINDRVELDAHISGFQVGIPKFLILFVEFLLFKLLGRAKALTTRLPAMFSCATVFSAERLVAQPDVNIGWMILENIRVITRIKGVTDRQAERQLTS